LRGSLLSMCVWGGGGLEGLTGVNVCGGGGGGGEMSVQVDVQQKSRCTTPLKEVATGTAHPQMRTWACTCS
jgi:hypothetical protein